MKTLLNPYLNFDNQAKEAMEFYKSVFGGKLQMHTYKEFNASQDPSEDAKIMHSMLEADNGITFMGADTPKGMPLNKGNNVWISLSGDNQEELSGYYNKLSEGGNIMEKLAKAPWGDTFGMFTDKFGTNWMVNISGQK